MNTRTRPLAALSLLTLLAAAILVLPASLEAQQTDQAAQLERMIATGRNWWMCPMHEWAESEPDAALKWYREKRASGDLKPGPDGDPHERVLTDLVCGLAASKPELAFKLYRDTPKKEMHEWTRMWMSSGFAKRMLKSGDETYLVKMLAYHRGDDEKRVLKGAIGEYARNAKFDAAMALVDKYDPAPEARMDYLAYIVSSGVDYDRIEGALDWLLAATPEAKAPELIGTIIGRDLFDIRISRAEKWLGRLRPGPFRDRCYVAVAEGRLDLRLNWFPQAWFYTEKIDDAARRAATQEKIEKIWREHDPKKAEQGLAAARTAAAARNITTQKP